MPTKQQLTDAINDITAISDLATEGLENLADEYGPSLDAMEENVSNEAESLLWASEDCFSYLEDNDITDWDDAIDDGNYNVESIAKFFLERAINNAIDWLRTVDFDTEYPEEEEEEDETEGD